MSLYRKLICIVVICIQISNGGRTLSNRSTGTRTCQDLLAALRQLQTTVRTYTEDRTNDVITDFRDQVLRANSKKELTCLSERFAAYYYNSAQHLLTGFSTAELGTIGTAINDVLTCGPEPTKALIDEVQETISKCKDHMGIWTSYVAPINKAQMNSYERCLTEEKSKHLDMAAKHNLK